MGRPMPAICGRGAIPRAWTPVYMCWEWRGRGPAQMGPARCAYAGRLAPVNGLHATADEADDDAAANLNGSARVR